MKKKICYVCAPFSGTPEVMLNNIARAKALMKHLLGVGYLPLYTPLLFDGIFDDSKPSERARVMDLCREYLEKSDIMCVWMVDGKLSKGQEMEVAWAKELGIDSFSVSDAIKKECGHD